MEGAKVDVRLYRGRERSLSTFTGSSDKGVLVFRHVDVVAAPDLLKEKLYGNEVVGCY